MPDLTPAVLQIMQRQLNNISVRQLRSHGVSRATQQRLLRDGVLEHIGKSVLRVPGASATMTTRLIVLCLQHPSGFVTGPTGGRVVGLRRMPPLSEIHFSALHGTRLDLPPGVRLRQTTRLFDGHTRTLENGIVVANWARLAFDLANDLPKLDLASVIEQMLHLGYCSLAELGAVARQLCAPARPGSVAFATVLFERGARAPAESHPEVRVLDGLMRRGVPVVPQVAHLALPGGGRVRIDMAVDAVRWGVEVDVHPAHFELVGTTRDARRDRQLHLIDWQVEHVTALDLLDLEGLLDELAELYRARVAAVATR
jgi:hypothetical protein